MFNLRGKLSSLSPVLKKHVGRKPAALSYPPSLPIAASVKPANPVKQARRKLQKLAPLLRLQMLAPLLRKQRHRVWTIRTCMRRRMVALEMLALETMWMVALETVMALKRENQALRTFMRDGKPDL